MVSFKRLSRMAILSFKNGYRLHLDSLQLLQQGSFPSATMLSVLAMEEFGKYFSLSSYIFYTQTNDTRDLNFEDAYLKDLYLHPLKQQMCFGRDGFLPSDELSHRASNREFEDLKQSSIYVGFKRIKGSICYEKPITNPLKISKRVASKQVRFLNRLLINMAKEHVAGIIHMDEDEVNEMLSSEMIRTLCSFKI
ncbi:AbiV family abortive infection protein [Bacteroidota bacterium]